MFNNNNNNNNNQQTEKEVKAGDGTPSRVIHHSIAGNTVISEKCIVTGEVTGSNDIEIFGQVNGTITLKNNSVRIEDTAVVVADIFVKFVKIYGKVTGNIEASERIVIPNNGSVIGDLIAPSIVLEDGAYFKGKITMTEEPVIDIKTAKTNSNKSADEKQGVEKIS